MKEKILSNLPTEPSDTMIYHYQHWMYILYMFKRACYRNLGDYIQKILSGGSFKPG